MIERFNIIFKCSKRFSRFSFNHYIPKSRPLILQASRSRNYESFRTWRAALAEIRAYPTCSVSLFLYHSLLKILVHNTHCQVATSKLIEKLAQYSHILQCEVQISAWLQCSDIVRNSRVMSLARNIAW